MIRAPHFHLTAHRIPYRCIVACLFETSNNFSYMKDFNSRKLITATNPIESYCTVDSTHIFLIIHGFFGVDCLFCKKKTNLIKNNSKNLPFMNMIPKINTQNTHSLAQIIASGVV